MLRLASVLISCLFASLSFARSTGEIEFLRDNVQVRQQLSYEEFLKSSKNVDCALDEKHSVCLELEQDKYSPPSKPQVPTQNSSGCLSYEPSVVELSGTIIRKSFPGPPNYESVRRGDTLETYWLLVLSRPICVDEDKSDPDLNPAQKAVRRVQLVFSDVKVYKTQKELVGKRVVARGTLFGSHTGHHHTRVLLIVSTLTQAR